MRELDKKVLENLTGDWLPSSVIHGKVGGSKSTLRKVLKRLREGDHLDSEKTSTGYVYRIKNGAERNCTVTGEPVETEEPTPPKQIIKIPMKKVEERPWDPTLEDRILRVLQGRPVNNQKITRPILGMLTGIPRGSLRIVLASMVERGEIHRIPDSRGGKYLYSLSP